MLYNAIYIYVCVCDSVTVQVMVWVGQYQKNEQMHQQWLGTI